MPDEHQFQANSHNLVSHGSPLCLASEQRHFGRFSKQPSRPLKQFGCSFQVIDDSGHLIVPACLATRIAPAYGLCERDLLDTPARA